MPTKTMKRLSRLLVKARLLPSTSISVLFSTLDVDLHGDPPPILFSQTPLPTLPNEVWNLILRCLLSSSLTFSLPDPFLTGIHDHVTRKQERASQREVCGLQLVCRSWRVAAVKLAYERLVLCCHTHMVPLIAVLEKTKARDSEKRGYGWWTREIECRRGTCPSEAGDDMSRMRVELQTYNADVARVLACTPNLLIYNNSNGWGKPLGLATHTVVLTALGQHCGSSLLRLEWAASESPRWVELQALLYQTPHLRALSVLHTFLPKAGTEPPVVYEKPCFLRYLRELRLGPFPTPFGAPIPYWDKVLDFLTPPEQPSPAPFTLPPLPTEDELQLPMLHSFSVTPVNILKPNTGTERFLTVYGSRIRHLRTSNLTPKDVLNVAESTAVVQNRSLRMMLELCPHLRSLIFNPLQPTHFPLAHATLERIGIFPPHENPINVPKRVFHSLIQAPVDKLLAELLSGNFPNLKVLRLRDVGSLSFLGRDTEWIEGWKDKLAERRVRFENREGMNFMLAIVDCMELMPDDV